MEVHVGVFYPSGVPGQNAKVSASIAALPPRRGEGRAGGDGYCVVSLKTAGLLSLINLQFSAELVDSATGVEWAGSSSARWRLVRAPGVAPRREARIQIERKHRAVQLAVPDSVLDTILKTGDGRLLVYDVDELLHCLRTSAPAAALSMVGKVLDGSIKIRARAEQWWLPSWDGLTVGRMLLEPEIKRRVIEKIGPGEWTRLQASGVYIRNVGAHQKFALVSMDEALASTRVLFEFMVRWWT
ncbi:MAG: hypothetical protein WA691_06480 [Thermoplasmata archaeon]